MGLHHANSHVIHINLSIYRNQAKTEVYCVKILAKTCERTELANHSQYDRNTSINFLRRQIIFLFKFQCQCLSCLLLFVERKTARPLALRPGCDCRCVQRVSTVFNTIIHVLT